MGDLVRDSMIASAVLDSVVLPVFIFRVWIRVRMQRVGWEDVWAIVAFVAGTLNVVSSWTFLVRSGSTSGAGHSSVVPTWIYMVSFTCLLWAVRISIIFSVIRIIPTTERLHTCGVFIIVLFCLTWTAIIVQNTITCVYAYRESPSSPYLRCSRLRALNVAEISIGSVSDLVTVIFPLCVLRHISLPRKRLRLLRLLFIANLVVQVICVFRVACQLAASLTPWTRLVMNLQVAACALVCNLLVVVTYLYRVLGYKKHGSGARASDSKEAMREQDGRTTPESSQVMTLTTVELLFLTDSDASDDNAGVSRPVSQLDAPNSKQGRAKDGHDALV